MTLSAIEKEVEIELKNRFKWMNTPEGRGYLYDIDGKQTVDEVIMTDFVMNVLRRVAEETFTAVMPEEIEGVYTETQSHRGHYERGNNNAIAEMHQNFIKFTEKV